LIRTTVNVSEHPQTHGLSAIVESATLRIGPFPVSLANR